MLFPGPEPSVRSGVSPGHGPSSKPTFTPVSWNCSLQPSGYRRSIIVKHVQPSRPRQVDFNLQARRDSGSFGRANVIRVLQEFGQSIGRQSIPFVWMVNVCRRVICQSASVDQTVQTSFARRKIVSHSLDRHPWQLVARPSTDRSSAPARIERGERCSPADRSALPLADASMS